MTSLLLKALVIWLVILVLAIANAVIREKLLVPAIGPELSLSVSGLLLSAIILLTVFMTIPWFSSTENKIYIVIGFSWLVLTLMFEFLFSHFVAGKPWYEIAEVFDITQGNLFVLALLTILIAPWLSAKIRGFI